MADYKVRITITEVHSTWVEADSEEEAIRKALEKLNAGELMTDFEYVETEVDDVDEGSEDDDG